MTRPEQKRAECEDIGVLVSKLAVLQGARVVSCAESPDFVLALPNGLHIAVEHSRVRQREVAEWNAKAQRFETAVRAALHGARGVMLQLQLRFGRGAIPGSEAARRSAASKLREHVEALLARGVQKTTVFKRALVRAGLEWADELVVEHVPDYEVTPIVAVGRSASGRRGVLQEALVAKERKLVGYRATRPDLQQFWLLLVTARELADPHPFFLVAEDATSGFDRVLLLDRRTDRVRDLLARPSPSVG